MREENRDIERSYCRTGMDMGRSHFRSGGMVHNRMPTIEISISTRVPDEKHHVREAEKHEQRRVEHKRERHVDDYYASFPKEHHETRQMSVKNHKESHHEEKSHTRKSPDKKRETGLGYNEAMRPSDYAKEHSASGNNRAQSDDRQFTGRKEKHGSLDEINGITKKLNTPANSISLGKANSQNYREGGEIDISYGPDVKFREDAEIRKLEQAAARFQKDDHNHPQTRAKTYRRGGKVDDDGREHHSWGDFVHGFKSIGSGIKHAAQGVGHGIEHIGSKALHGVESAGKDVYGGLKEAGEQTYSGLKKAAPYLAQAGEVALPIIGESAGSLLGPVGAMAGSALGNVGSSVISQYAPAIGGRQKQQVIPQDDYSPQSEEPNQTYRRGGSVDCARTTLEDETPHGHRKGSMINIKHPGRLHDRLGIPKGEKIPMRLIKQAEHSKSKSLRKEAQFADNFRNRPQGR